MAVAHGLLDGQQFLAHLDDVADGLLVMQPPRSLTTSCLDAAAGILVDCALQVSYDERVCPAILAVSKNAFRQQTSATAAGERLHPA